MEDPTVSGDHGSGVIATGTEGLTVIVYARVAVRPRTSVALNVTVLVPALVGVPLMSA